MKKTQSSRYYGHFAGIGTVLCNVWLLLNLGMAPIVAQESAAQWYYINQYKDLAIREMIRTGIPASITLAQGLLESNAGQSELAVNANNQFGIKCGNNWLGPTYLKKDDDYDQSGQLTFSCFRAYTNPDDSFLDHSNYLTNPSNAYRYGSLFDLDPTAYRAWALGLQQAGYATSLTYPERLISLIERYRLNQYDLIFPAPSVPPPTTYPILITTTNEVPNTLASGYETAEDIAYRTQVDLEQLLDANEGLVAGYVLPQGTKVYLEAKRRSFRGPIAFHEVQAGESLYDIAQRYGIRLEQLQRRNRLEPGQPLEPGRLIKLRGGRIRSAMDSIDGKDSGFNQDTWETPQDTPPNFPPAPPPLEPTMDNPAPTAPVRYHTVEKNDTLWNIARRYQTTVEQLKLLNNLNDSLIRRGIELRVQ